MKKKSIIHQIYYTFILAQPHLQIKKNFNSRHNLDTNRSTQIKAIQMGKLLRFILL